MTTEQEDELRQYLESVSKRECWFDDDDFSPCDYAGGNYDDAYYGGSDDGEALFARQLLSKYFPQDPIL
jgi:hypothetical protein